MTHLVHYEADAGVALLTLSDAPKNGTSYEMLRELDEAILRARFDEDVHVLVLTGAGEEYFSAGASLHMLRSVTDRFRFFLDLYTSETLSRLEQTPKLVIAALNGHALGGGLEVAMACDLRIARAGDFLLGFPQLEQGLLPGAGGCQRLVRALGKSRALAWMASGKPMAFEEAQQLGLVQEVLEGEGFLSQVLALARGYCPPHKASRALGLLKRSCQTGAELPLQEAQALHRELNQQLLFSQDAREGLDAALEKRTPAFQGL
jgi:enoyl-CoA hydratase/carnithine racemase